MIAQVIAVSILVFLLFAVCWMALTPIFQTAQTPVLAVLAIVLPFLCLSVAGLVLYFKRE